MHHLRGIGSAAALSMWSSFLPLCKDGYPLLEMVQAGITLKVATRLSCAQIHPS